MGLFGEIYGVYATFVWLPHAWPAGLPISVHVALHDQPHTCSLCHSSQSYNVAVQIVNHDEAINNIRNSKCWSN